MSKKHPDHEIIAALGGPSRVARMLDLPLIGGVQRVHNWTTRGIPSAVRLKYLVLFAQTETGKHI
jgi:hypothetical protein